jgi:hypothetical protein
MKFTSDGSLAYVTFHGSWNRDVPVGYKLSVLSFANGQPVEPADSKKAAVDILSNPDISACPGKCFRPVGLAIDSRNRVFMTSDATGDIYVLRRSDMTATGTNTGGGTLVTSTNAGSPNAVAGMQATRTEGWMFMMLTLTLAALGGMFFVAA